MQCTSVHWFPLRFNMHIYMPDVTCPLDVINLSWEISHSDANVLLTVEWLPNMNLVTSLQGSNSSFCYKNCNQNRLGTWQGGVVSREGLKIIFLKEKEMMLNVNVVRTWLAFNLKPQKTLISFSATNDLVSLLLFFFVTCGRIYSLCARLISCYLSIVRNKYPAGSFS